MFHNKAVPEDAHGVVRSVVVSVEGKSDAAAGSTVSATIGTTAAPYVKEGDVK